ncbi:MAG: hypothetical protein ABEJ36_00270 [Candidatus Nanosalina sp.]
MKEETDGFSEEGVLEKAEELGWEEIVQRMLDEKGDPGSISSEMNMYYGVLNSSRGQSGSEPRLLVYDHSPGFESGDSGMVKVSGKDPDAIDSSRVPGQGNVFTQDQGVDTKYIRFGVLPEESMPVAARYSGGDVPEVVLEHEEVEMMEGENVTFQVHPYDPEDITGESWQENLQNYDGEGDVSFVNTRNT